jgi:hypothetical protein
MLGRLSWAGLGALLLLLGSGMAVTLILLPVGLPLALFGLALMAADHRATTS